jgi:hypothetical protein
VVPYHCERGCAQSQPLEQKWWKWWNALATGETGAFDNTEEMLFALAPQ